MFFYAHIHVHMLMMNIHKYVEREGPNGEKSLFNTNYKTLALKLGNMLSFQFREVKLFIKILLVPGN